MAGHSHRSAQFDTDVVGSRAGAVLVDGLVGIVLYFVGSAVLLGGMGTSGLLMAFFVLPFVVFVGYHILLEAFWDGQTVGKKVMGVRVLREDGAPIGIEEAVVRNLLRFVDGALYYAVGFFFMSTSPRNQRLGDRVAGTIVVDATPAGGHATATSGHGSPGDGRATSTNGQPTRSNATRRRQTATGRQQTAGQQRQSPRQRQQPDERQRREGPRTEATDAGGRGRTAGQNDRRGPRSPGKPRGTTSNGTVQ